MTRIAAIAVMLSAAPSLAAEPPRWMDGAELRAAFAGQTLEGYYRDGVSFAETYKQGGAIDYRDDRLATTGNWSIAGRDICTFYIDLTGGCFRAYRVSGNCFRFYLAAEADQKSPAQMGEQSFEATGWVTGSPSTCPAPPTV